MDIDRLAERIINVSDWAPWEDSDITYGSDGLIHTTVEVAHPVTFEEKEYSHVVLCRDTGDDGGLTITHVGNSSDSEDFIYTGGMELHTLSEKELSAIATYFEVPIVDPRDIYIAQIQDYIDQSGYDTVTLMHDNAWLTIHDSGDELTVIKLNSDNSHRLTNLSDKMLSSIAATLESSPTIFPQEPLTFAADNLNGLHESAEITAGFGLG